MRTLLRVSLAAEEITVRRAYGSPNVFYNPKAQSAISVLCKFCTPKKIEITVSGWCGRSCKHLDSNIVAKHVNPKKCNKHEKFNCSIDNVFCGLKCRCTEKGNEFKSG